MTVRILTGDCRDLLPTIEHADALITDPVWPNCPEGLIAGWDRPAELLAEAMAVAPPSVRRVVIILRSDSDPRFLQAVPQRWPFVCTQAMSYAVPMYLGRVLGGTELAYCFGQPIPSREGKRVIPMWGPKAQPANRKANGHPCSRAMVHMEWLIHWWSEPGETVLDPFCGSGTIPLAAERMQRHGIGIELNNDYTVIANRRIADDAPLLDHFPTSPLPASVTNGGGR
jgi:site-specific DNA-methyltransferase (adenine-specific)